MADRTEALDLGGLLDRLAERVSGGLDVDLDIEVVGRLAELRESIRLTPTFLDRRGEAQDLLDDVMAEFGRAVVAYDRALT